MRRSSRRQFLAAVGVTAFAGCQRDTPRSTTVTPVDVERSGSHPAVPTADGELILPTTPDALREAAQSGGPEKDAIPSIDEPRFLDPGAVDYLDPGDPVFGVRRDGVTRAYPQKILAQHEIVNDVIDGTPVSVTYCPLTGTVQGFERGETTFAVSGRLINSNLVMCDRESFTWWPQMLATSIPGSANRDPPIATLREFRVIWTTWERWRTHHPETAVLSTETGHARNYERDPYGSYNPADGYYDTDNLLFPALNDDDRHPNKAVVLGARTDDGAAAFLQSSLREDGVMTGRLAGDPVLAVNDPRFDTGYVYRNPDERRYDPVEDGVRGPDGEVRSPDALDLDRILAFDAMWFAWAGYYPETSVYA